MKKLFFFLLLCPLFLNAEIDRPELFENFINGDPDIESINAMAFGPEGILFVGDSKNASIVAINTKDQKIEGESAEISLENVDMAIASLLGRSPSEITIQDMAVNPASKTVYFGVHDTDGTPVLLKLKDGKFSHFSLNNLEYSKLELKKAVGVDAEDRRGRSLRSWAISDLAYYGDKVMVSGLSNEEFSSSFRSIPFPFNNKQSISSLEIYHAAHGQYETYAPIKTFRPFQLHGQDHLVASYTCTPLVIFPMKDLHDGNHVKGMTVAELGNRNTPLDIISYKKDDKEFLLMSNSSRALMKIDPMKIENFDDYLTTPVEESSATAGIEFITLPYVNVQQMDKLDDQQVVMLQRMADGHLNLHTVGTRRL